MVVPWVGFPLAKLLDQVQPNSQAKYVAFETLADPKQMPNIRIECSRVAVRRRVALG